MCCNIHLLLCLSLYLLILHPHPGRVGVIPLIVSSCPLQSLSPPLTDIFLKHNVALPCQPPPASNSQWLPNVYIVILFFWYLWSFTMLMPNFIFPFLSPNCPLQIDRSPCSGCFFPPRSLKLRYDSHTSQLINQLITISIYRNAINPSIAHLK